MSVMRKVKKSVLNVLILGPTAKGFTAKEAKRWVRGVYGHYFKPNRYSFSENRWAIKRGFFAEQIDRLGLNEENYKDTISVKDYAFLRPLNGTYSKWITDRITINSIFKPYRDVMPKCYYQIYKRDTETAIIPLHDFSAGNSFEDVVEMLEKIGTLRIRKAKGKKSRLLAYVNGTYYFGTEIVTKEELVERLSSYQSIVVITENIIPKKEFDGAVLHLTIFNEQGDNPTLGDANLVYKKSNTSDSFLDEILVDGEIEDDTLDEVDELPETAENEDENLLRAVYAYVNPKTGQIGEAVSLEDGQKVIKTENPNNGCPIEGVIPFWDDIVKTVDSMCRFVPQLEFYGLEIILCDDGFKIMNMFNHPSYPKVVPFSKETSDYLKHKVEQKKEAYRSTSVRIQRGFKKIKLKVRATYAKLFFPRGLKPYLSIRWFQDLKKDFLTNKDTTLSQKLWAAKHGFLSYRLPQYGITKDNHLNYISDFEYKWLRHINNKYRYWMEDKITVKYICSEYNSCFPEYYYHISLKNGNNRIIPMMDCPKDYGNTYEDIFQLVRKKGALALKPDEGSHGDGFYKFSYEDGKYYLNHQEATLDDVQSILDDVNNQYLVTEYIDMHQEIKRIYDGAVNTIRMIVFKKDGVNPVIGNAYMRFGSKRTGAVDNMGAGGMFAKIDIETGKFYDAKIIEANEIKPCLYHPDTGVKIEGYLPNWEKVKMDVLNVARNIPQLEYFGFDLALTEDGLKFPEINRFPDYPAIEKYTPQTIDYLLYKLEQKKKKFGYDVSRGNTLVKLPKR